MAAKKQEQENKKTEPKEPKPKKEDLDRFGNSGEDDIESDGETLVIK